MANAENDKLESHMLRELALVNRRINELELEKQTLERLITRIRRDGIGEKEISRKSSMARILIEKTILEKLENVGGRSLTTRELYRTANTVDLTIKESTFRSYIHRLNRRGLIESPKYGRWRLIKS